MKLSKLFVRFLIVAFLTGCGPSFTLVKDERNNVSKNFSVQPGMEWNQLKRNSLTFWTANGLMLDEIVFVESIADGKTLFGDDKSNPFKTNMSEIEIAELFIESFKNTGNWPNGKYQDLKLQKFGSFDGFNFGINLINQDGLSYKGIASGAVIEKELHIIFFLATEFHYYDKFKNNFQAIVSSIQKT